MTILYGPHLLRRLESAAAKYGQPASSHESLGVIAEEYHELIEAIRENDVHAARREALDVAASALRLAEACEFADSAFMERSGFAA